MKHVADGLSMCSRDRINYVNEAPLGIPCWKKIETSLKMGGCIITLLSEEQIIKIKKTT